MHSHIFNYGDLCQMYLIWQREGGLSSEKMAQFVETLLDDFDLVPDEALELMANLPASSSDGLVMPLDLGNSSVLLSERAVVAATALAVIQNTALLSSEDRAALQKEALKRIPEGRQLHACFDLKEKLCSYLTLSH